MKNIIIYGSRPRKMYASKEDVKFMTYLKKLANNKGDILADGHDFKFVPSISLNYKIEKIVCKVDKVMVLHIDGVIDQNQYYEVISALMHNIPVIALNVNGRKIKKVEGISRYFDAGINKRAILALVDIPPN
jgi:basic membrane lipoprotein Med (substrate-binding protein (PBP1-ABC) superfamily)